MSDRQQRELSSQELAEQEATDLPDRENMSLINACQYLISMPTAPRDGEIAVSQRYFQSDNGLDATGELDGSTIAKLDEVAHR